MFKLRAAQRLLGSKVEADDIEQHREQDELQTQEFMQQADVEETTAADTLRSRDPRDVVPYMFARKLAAAFRHSPQFKVRAQQDLPQNQLDHPADRDIDLLVDTTEAAMGDNIAETDPLMQNYENTNPRYLKADSTVDSPFDNFDNKSIPSLMFLEDQQDLVHGSLRALASVTAAKKKHKKKPTKKMPSKLMRHTRTKHPHKKSLVDRLLDEDSLMYRNEASSKAASVDYEDLPAGETSGEQFNVSTGGQKFTYNSDNQPGSVHVRFPISDSPTDGSSYMHVRGEAAKRLNAGFNDEQQEAPDMLGEPSEDGEIQILSSDAEDSDEEQEVLGDADAKSLWNVAQQPLS